jgi:hypothetical protein
MAVGTPEQGSKNGAPPAAPRAAGPREKMQSGVEAGRDKGTAHAEPEGGIEEEPHNPVALGVAFLAVLILVLGVLFILNQTRCDPLFSDIARTKACR